MSELTELEATVLRYWEKEFPQLRPKHNRAGKRMYREKDIRVIREIKRLTRDEGFTIAGAKKRIQEFSKGAKIAEAKMDRVTPVNNSDLPPELLDYLRKELNEIKEMLSAEPGCSIKIQADGTDTQDTVNAILKMVENNAGEGE